MSSDNNLEQLENAIILFEKYGLVGRDAKTVYL